MERSEAELLLLLTGLNTNPCRSRTSHLEEMLRITFFSSKQNISDSLLAPCFHSPPRSKKKEVFWDSFYVSVT